MRSEFDAMKHSEAVQSSFTSPVRGSVAQALLQKVSFFMQELSKRLQTAASYRYLAHHHPDIVEAQLSARRDGGLSGDYQWLRLFELVALVDEFGPTSIIELGCGTSSLLFAKQMRDRNRVTTCEESQYWLDRMLTTAGALAANLEPLASARILVERDYEHGTYYDIDHTRYYDFVYVDGPSSFHLNVDPNALKLKDPDKIIPNLDVELFWANGVFPRVIVVDGRRPTVRRLIERNDGRYHVYLKSEFAQRTGIVNFSWYRYHTLFVRSE